MFSHLAFNFYLLILIWDDDENENLYFNCDEDL